MSDVAILCVDDEKVILDSLKRQLRRRFGTEYMYEVAESAEEAWEVIEELVEDGVKIVVIVSDWLMPGVKGDEFLIRVHEQHPDIVKIMLTGQADETAVARAKIEANLHSCLYKPWSEQELVDAITSGLPNT
jgi:CheY-like chemotaxis protein